jgi:hypothetical protein
MTSEENFGAQGDQRSLHRAAASPSLARRGIELRSTASYAIAQVDYFGAETARLKEFEIPS